jgi:hypothetical protein
MQILKGPGRFFAVFGGFEGRRRNWLLYGSSRVSGARDCKLSANGGWNRSRSAALLVFCFFLVVPASLYAQATTSTVIGTVKDPQEAVVVGAQVKLESKAINVSMTQTTNTSGQYTFVNVIPGTYTITTSMSGFQTANVSNFRIEVGKSYTVDFRLLLGEVSQTVMVESGEVVKELQTSDATIGNVISGSTMPLLPALTRRANEFVALQPMVVPEVGAVAGARNDQSTFTLNGIDITNNSIGGGAANATLIPLPIDSVEEFRVGVSNPTSDFGRGAGGQVRILGKTGTSSYHGVVYWYHQNDNLNANTWTNNRNGIKKSEQKDNRFGFNFGGPIPFIPYLKDRTFFFANYEGRRFPRTSPFTRVVPLPSLRQGILRFPDATGVVRDYPVANFDPRGLGMSPTIQAQFDLLPAPNGTGGDQNNTSTLEGDVSNPINNDIYILRFDHNISSNWRANVHFIYFGQLAQNTAVLDISGLGGSSVVSRDSAPERDNFLSAGLSGSITPNISAIFQFGWVRTRTATDRMRPNASAEFLAIPGTQTGLPTGEQQYFPLDIGARGGADSVLSEPIDYDTQRARKQGNDNKLYQWNADLSWIWRKHTFQFGSHVRYLPTLHLRDDKVIGALGALVASIDANGQFVSLSSTRPPACTASVTTNCLPASQTQNWDRLFAGLTGIVDGVSVLAVWDGDFNPLPFGTQLEADTKLWAPEFYFQDTWRIWPSFTFTVGVNYGWQQAPTERLGRQSVQADALSQEFFTAPNFLERRLNASLTGQIYNPNFAFWPVDSANRKVFNVDWNNVAPRFAVAWNPSFKSGFLGALFGNRKTVIRGGYGLLFDRQNTVQSVIVPTLGVAFAQTLTLSAPVCNATGAGGTNCNATSADQALSSFRVGQDGTIPVPTVPGRSIPVQPFWGINTSLAGCSTPQPTALVPSSCLTQFPESFSFQVDPNIQVGKNHAVDVTWQRELPWDILMEVGYVGRFARELPQSMNLAQAPYTHVDSASGQSFAEAFDAVRLHLVGNPASTVPVQPWFENNLPIGACVVSGSPVSCTRFIATNQGSNFNNSNVNSIFVAIDALRLRGGLQPFDNLGSFMYFLRSSTGWSNYNAGFLTLHKRTAKGLTLTANYTFSRSLDMGSANQNAANVMGNNFFLDSDYGRSDFDFNHVFNTIWRYELPFGKNRWIGTDNAIIDRFIGGWSVSGIFTSTSGAPLTVTQGSQTWGGAFQLGFNSGAILTNPGAIPDNSSQSIAVCTTPPAAPVSPCSPTGLNLFGADPNAARGAFRRVELSRDGRAGRNVINGMPRWNLDLSLAKRTSITEHVSFTFLFDFLNAFNHVDFANPTLAITNLTTFGNITDQFTPTNRTNGARWIQFGARISF